MTIPLFGKLVSATGKPYADAAMVDVDVAGFVGNLSITDNEVQKVLETIDGLKIDKGVIIDNNHFFADEAARDAYFPYHLNELKNNNDEHTYIAVGAAFQRWDGVNIPSDYNTPVWTDITAIVAGQKGDKGDAGDPTLLIDDATSSLTKTYSSDKIHDLISLFFNSAVRQGDDLVFTRSNGSTITIPIGATYDATSIKDFSMDIPTRISIGTNIDKLTNIYYNIANSQNVISIGVNVSGGQITGMTLPQQDGHISTSGTISGVDTSTAKNIEFQIVGNTTDPGITYKSNIYTVQVADPSTIKDIYYGASSDEAVNVDLTTFTKIPYIKSLQTESFNIPVIAGEYYYIFVPQSPGISGIYNTTFGDFDVTAEFSSVPGGQTIYNVQTINGIAYTSYRRGPSPYVGSQDIKVVMK